MNRLKTKPSECHTIRQKTVCIRKEHKCFGCCQLFQKECNMTVHTVVGINEIYDMYLCEQCENISDQCSEDIYVEGEIGKMRETE